MIPYFLVAASFHASSFSDAQSSKLLRPFPTIFAIWRTVLIFPGQSSTIPVLGCIVVHFLTRTLSDLLRISSMPSSSDRPDEPRSGLVCPPFLRPIQDSFGHFSRSGHRRSTAGSVSCWFSPSDGTTENSFIDCDCCHRRTLCFSYAHTAQLSPRNDKAIWCTGILQRHGLGRMTKIQYRKSR